LPSSSLKGVCSLILFSLFATGVIDTGGNLPPASLTPAKFSAGIVDTSGKFATGINDTVENLPPVSLIPAAILQPGH
jgi:hypothetical protein